MSKFKREQREEHEKGWEKEREWKRGCNCIYFQKVKRKFKNKINAFATTRMKRLGRFNA